MTTFDKVALVFAAGVTASLFWNYRRPMHIDAPPIRSDYWSDSRHTLVSFKWDASTSPACGEKLKRSCVEGYRIFSGGKLLAEVPANMRSACLPLSVRRDSRSFIVFSVRSFGLDDGGSPGQSERSETIVYGISGTPILATTSDKVASKCPEVSDVR